MTEHVANQEHQRAQDGEDHYGDDSSNDGRIPVYSIPTDPLLIEREHSTSWVQVPGIVGRGHGGDGEGWGSTVGLDQNAVCGDRGYDARAQRGLEGGDVVELDPGETAHEAWRVVLLNQDGVDLACLC